jgi:mycothiol system anti-sigma-R factor
MDPCDHCEEVMQPYLDRTLDDAEVATASAHLQECAWCRNRYRFEEHLRQFVRTACTEGMPPDLKERLAALRTPLL